MCTVGRGGNDGSNNDGMTKATLLKFDFQSSMRFKICSSVTMSESKAERKAGFVY